jgi:hypothetical protein
LIGKVFESMKPKIPHIPTPHYANALTARAGEGRRRKDEKKGRKESRKYMLYFIFSNQLPASPLSNHDSGNISLIIL